MRNLIKNKEGLEEKILYGGLLISDQTAYLLIRKSSLIILSHYQKNRYKTLTSSNRISLGMYKNVPLITKNEIQRDNDLEIWLKKVFRPFRFD